MTPRLSVLLVGLLLAGATPVHAHEIGTTRVSVLLDGTRSYDVEIVTDAASLADKLEAANGRSLPVTSSPSALELLLHDSDGAFRARVALAFDAVAVQPRIRYTVQPATTVGGPPAAIIHLTGDIPPHATHLEWRYAWTFASYALTVRTSPAAPPTTVWLEGDAASAPIPLASSPASAERWRTAWRYLVLGFTHILPGGIDHMLFVLGIYLLSGRARSVLWQVSAFTVAHSITLGLGLYGLIAAPPRVVEPLIALSIAYVAIENVFLSELRSWRLALVFAFGLLHGMGFAGALKELGLPRSEFLTALLTFNIGVEAGQMTVIAAAFVLLGWHWRHRDWYRRRIVVPVSLLIACTAVYWTIERLAL
jgi:hydrogenase/urease accessory protein HupE